MSGGSPEAGSTTSSAGLQAVCGDAVSSERVRLAHLALRQLGQQLLVAGLSIEHPWRALVADALGALGDTASAIEAPAAPRVAVDITATVERDFEDRGVFPDLRIERAERRFGVSKGRYRVSIATVHALLEDALLRGQCNAMPRGLKRAYRSFVRQLQYEVQRAEEEGPGLDETGAAPITSGGTACFAAGDQALYRRSNGLCERVLVASAFQGFSVEGDSGAIERRMGYLVDVGRGQYFVAAHKLLDVDGAVRHVRLAAVAGDPVSVASEVQQ